MIHTLSPSPDLFIKNQPSDWHKDGRERTRKSLQQIVSGDGSRPISYFKAKNHRESIKNNRRQPRRGQPAKRPPATGTVPVQGPRCGREECPSDPESKQGQTSGLGCATEPCLRRGFFLASSPELVANDGIILDKRRMPQRKDGADDHHPDNHRIVHTRSGAPEPRSANAAMQTSRRGAKPGQPHQIWDLRRTNHQDYWYVRWMA